MSAFGAPARRAANWLRLGATQGRTRNDREHSIHAAVKDVYLYPLAADFRQRLCLGLNVSQKRVQHLEEQQAAVLRRFEQTPARELALAQRAAHRRPARTFGRTLRIVEKPDHTVSHPVNQCAGCRSSLAEQAPDRVERRQVFDLPEPKLEVTEHQSEVKTCTCGCLNRAAFPPEVTKLAALPKNPDGGCLNRAAFPPEATAPVQYGLRVKSAAVYLKEYQWLPFDRLAAIMRDLFACDTFSEGTLANFSAACSQRLEPMEAIIREQATAARPRGRPGGLRRNRNARHRLAALAAHRFDPLADLVLRP